MAKQTKEQKIAQLKKLITKLHGRGKQWEFDQVYRSGRMLDDYVLLEVLGHIDWETPNHPPVDWFREDELDARDSFWLKRDAEASEAFGIIRGAKVVQFLDGLKQQLGPDPENAIIVWDNNDDGYCIAQRSPTTNAELDRILKAMQNVVEGEERDERESIDWRRAAIEREKAK